MSREPHRHHRAASITANNQTKVYGANLPTLTASYSGFVNGDTAASLDALPTFSTTATAASGTGAYTITAGGAVDADYTISYVGGTLTVTSAGLTITAVNQTKVYGAALPTLTASYSGFVNGDTFANLTTQPTLSTTATASSHVSGNPYTITASGAVDADYSITYVTGNLTVTAAPLTISANYQTKAYGVALPALTVSYTGFVNGDTAASLTTQPIVTTTATASSHVSGNPYAITASGAIDSDYSITYAAGSLTVTPVALTITTNNQTKVYGGALPTLTASYQALSMATPLPASRPSPVSRRRPRPVAMSRATRTRSRPREPSTATTQSAMHPRPDHHAGGLDDHGRQSDQGLWSGGADPLASYTGFVNGDTSASLTTQPAP